MELRSSSSPVACVAAQVSSFPLSTMFGMCSAFLAVCAICQRRLDRVVHAEKGQELADSNASLLGATSLGKGSPGVRKTPLDNL